MKGSPTAPIVRPPWNDMVTFKRLLDVGVQTLLVPYIQTEEEAQQAVSYTRYPPHGCARLCGVHPAPATMDGVKGYAQHSSEEICVLLQVETVLGPAKHRSHCQRGRRGRRVHRPR